ncbi:hypothetical protein J1614_005595 [Plenodomus biglobosus]|nr:hypothetical protein J1614_005595 [Plenodomus biglobosus]
MNTSTEALSRSLATRSVEDLYTPLAAILLSQSAVTKITSLDVTMERSARLPSWCPDLHHRPLADVLPDNNRYHASFTIQTTTSFQCNMEQFEKAGGKFIVMDPIEDVTSAM